MAVLAKKVYTPEEYLEIERAADHKSEHVNGEIVAMSGATYTHTKIATNVTVEIRSRLCGTDCEALTSDIRVQTSATHYCYPDLTVVCGKPLLADHYRDTILNPVLVLEILSPSTADYDSGLKFERYKRIESLREYVLVWQDRPQIGRWLLTDSGWISSVVEGLDAAIHLDSVGIDLPLAAVYGRVDFPPS